MKKLMTFFAIAAMFSFVACQKPANNKPSGDNNQDEQKVDPKDDEKEPEYVKAITIDGTFDDWAALDASKVITAKCADPTAKTDLKLLKVYVDELYIFAYVEFDFTPYDNAPDVAHLDFHINGDGDTATGGWNGQWDQGETPCIDLMCQGDIISEGNVIDYAPGLYKYAGAPNTSEWAWEDVSIEGFIEGKGTKKAFEVQMMRELYPLGDLADEISLGVEILVNGWDATGALPNAETDEVNTTGQAGLLTVKLN